LLKSLANNKEMIVMNPIVYIKKQYWQLLNDSWLGRIIPFGISLLVFSLLIEYILHLPLSDKINTGIWATFGLLCLNKYDKLRKEKKNQKSKPKPPPEEFYM